MCNDLPDYIAEFDELLRDEIRHRMRLLRPRWFGRAAHPAAV